MAKAQAKSKLAERPELVPSKPKKAPLSAEQVVDSTDSDTDSSVHDDTSSSAESSKPAASTKSSALSNRRKSTESDIESSGNLSASPNGVNTSEDSEEDSGEESSSPVDNESRSGNKNQNVLARTTSYSELGRPYEPPSGFNAVDPRASKLSESHRLFESFKLAGKQLWHISAPANVPLAHIKELALDKIAKGEAIIDHNGTSYGLTNDTQAQQDCSILLPSISGYARAGADISRSFKLNQVVSLPSFPPKSSDRSTGGVESLSLTARPIKPARPQPNGLRMRYKPTGFGAEDPGTIGSSDSEEDAYAPKESSQSKSTPILPPVHTPKKLKTSKKAVPKSEATKILPPGYKLTEEKASSTIKGSKDDKRKRKNGDGKEESEQKKKKKRDKETKGARSSTKIS